MEKRSEIFDKSDLIYGLSEIQENLKDTILYHKVWKKGEKMDSCGFSGKHYGKWGKDTG